MNILFIVAGAALTFIFFYKTYGAFLAKKVFKLNDKRQTPAVSCNDGVDFVPAESKFLMGQHFSAIAAAGPITGPIIAGVMFGWVPALIWIVLGSVFIGGVHDMGSIVASIRYKAKSITEVVKANVSKRAWILFMLFIWITLVYVVVAFTDVTSSSFVGTITLENGEKVGGGAIAASSLLYLILPVIMGVLLKKTKLSLTLATIIFLPLVGVSIWIGPSIAFDLESWFNLSPHQTQKVWNGFILAYCFLASIIPVWLLLQPRGHLGGYFLYTALAASAVGLIFGGFSIQYPAFTASYANVENFWFLMFPVLFITVACGACSGFHSLVGSGTTSKQLAKESDAKVVGYGMMLLEGMVAVVSLACVMILAKDSALIKSSPNFIYASGIGQFVQLIGIPAALGISFGLMAFTTFVYDTLDVCTRLCRYIIEELSGWKTKFSKYFATGISILVPLLFVTSTMNDEAGNPIPAWKMFWSIFGACNQMLAALALIGITVWLYKTAENKYAWIVSFLPAVWMFLMSNWAFLVLMRDGWFNTGSFVFTGNPVPIVSLILLTLSVTIAAETAYAVVLRKNKA
ncbi:MAG: carbon starvation protein [Ignavibacteria bacterium]|nr:MAG: carbon starvation protein [Ignavibacteria bacterium]KAF0161537.1 MAG: carbon starvation protein [Ignavibacteria bacterium]